MSSREERNNSIIPPGDISSLFLEDDSPEACPYISPELMSTFCFLIADVL